MRNRQGQAYHLCVGGHQLRKGREAEKKRKAKGGQVKGGKERGTDREREKEKKMKEKKEREGTGIKKVKKKLGCYN